MTGHKTRRTVWGYLAALVVIRVGEYVLDAVFGEQIGYLSHPLIALGLLCIYGALIAAILITFFARIRTAIVVRYPRIVQTFSAPVLSTRAVRIGLLLLMLAALGMNSVLFLRNPNFGVDAFSYYFPVHNFLAGDGYVIQARPGYLPPGYGLLIALFFRVTGNIETAAMLVSACAYLLTVPVAYHIGTLLAGRLTGFMAAFFFTFCPLLVRFSFASLITMSSFFFATLGLWLYLRVVLKPPAYTRSLWLGCVLGYTLLLKEQGLVLALLVIVWLFLTALIAAFRQRTCAERIPLWKRCSYPAATLGIIAIFLGFQTYMTYALTGNWVIYTRLSYVIPARQSAQPTPSDNTQPPPAPVIRRQPAVPPPVAVEIAPVEPEVRQAAKPHREVHIIDYRPPAFAQIAANARMAAGHLVTILMHTFVPGLFGVWLCGGVMLTRRGTFPPCPSILTVTARQITIGAAFVIFLVPVSVPIVLNHVESPRHILENTGPFLILAALMLVTLLRVIVPRQIVYGVIVVCVISLLTVFGVFNESPLLNNRFLSRTYSLSPEAARRLWEEGLAYKAARRVNRLLGAVTFGLTDGLLHPVEAYAEKHHGGLYYPILRDVLIPQLRYQTLEAPRKILTAEGRFAEDLVEPHTTRRYTFDSAREFLNAIATHVDEDILQQFRDRFLKFARVSPYASYETLRQVLATHGSHRNLRAEGFWLQQNYAGNLDHIAIMTTTRSLIVLFYANGSDKEPLGRATTISRDAELDAVVAQMRAEHVAYLFLERDYAATTWHLWKLWGNRELAQELGLTLVHRDPQNIFEVYTLNAAMPGNQEPQSGITPESDHRAP